MNRSFCHTAFLAFALLGLGSGCASFGYTGKSRDLASDALTRERGWVAVHGVPLYRQQAHHDCGPTALAMVMRYHRHDADVRALLERPRDSQVSAAELRELARARGFSAFVLEGTVEDLVHEIKEGRPVIVGMAKPTALGPIAHYEVLVGMHRDTQRFATIDPAVGLRQNTFKGFLEEWVATGNVLLVVMPEEKPRAKPSDPESPHVAANPTQGSPPANSPRAALQGFSSVSGAAPR